jgi:hypothetical protein
LQTCEKESCLVQQCSSILYVYDFLRFVEKNCHVNGLL